MSSSEKTINNETINSEEVTNTEETNNNEKPKRKCRYCTRIIPDDVPEDEIYCSDACRETRSNVQKDYYKRNRKEIIKKNLEYNKENRDKARNASKRYYASMTPEEKFAKLEQTKEAKREWARKYRERKKQESLENTN